ncbi:MAG: 4-hydroxy-tetrahydrodipicolinate synthase [Proteobacteria bacterium]|nr:4-hydroxy-tetrahydrodipicolinate synthase [Pseudomonadota bacterium]
MDWDVKLAEAVKFHQSGQLSPAEALYREILKADPEHPRALNLLGVVRLQGGRFDDGAGLIERSVAINPGDADALNNLGQAYESLGRPDDAAGAYRRALAVDPGSAAAHINLGNVLGGQGDTAEAIALTLHAKEAGADAALIVTPYYNKPTQEGLFQHYQSIHDAVDLPIIIYNIPSRSMVDMSLETMARLAELPNIVGVKDATSQIARVSATRLMIGSDFCQLSGEDATALAVLAHGGHGCISVTANIAPRMCAEFHDAWAGGRPDEALGYQDRLMPLHSALFIETSPAPVKYGASLLDRCTDEVRLPLVGIKDQTKEKVRVAMQSAGLIN